MTTQEVAGLLGVSSSFVCRLAKLGVLKATRYGRSWVISKASVDKYMAKKAK